MRTQQIEAWTQALVKSYGKPRKPINTSVFYSEFIRREYTKLVVSITRDMKLDMKMKIGYVRSGGPTNAPAWVMIPAYIPMLGTNAFRQWTVEMFIRKSFLEGAPFHAVMSTLSHECAHILLSSTRHPLARVEEVVDLTAMFLGYRDIFVQGVEYFHMPSLETISGAVKSITLENVLDTSAAYRAIEMCTPEERKLGYMSTEEYRFAQKILASYR